MSEWKFTTDNLYRLIKDLARQLNANIATIGSTYMLKSIYDTDANGIVDSAEEVSGSTSASQYYGTNASNVKGFYNLPAAGGDVSSSTSSSTDSHLAIFDGTTGKLIKQGYDMYKLPVDVNLDPQQATGITGTTQQIAWSSPINSGMTAGNFDLEVLVTKGAVSISTIKIYTNTTNSLSGATQLAQFTMSAAEKWAMNHRKMIVRSVSGSNNTNMFLTTSNAITDTIQSANAISRLTINWSGVNYLIVSVQNSVGGETTYIENVALLRRIQVA